jgi:hypothetical protein
MTARPADVVRRFDAGDAGGIAGTCDAPDAVVRSSNRSPQKMDAGSLPD